MLLVARRRVYVLASDPGFRDGGVSKVGERGVVCVWYN